MHTTSVSQSQHHTLQPNDDACLAALLKTDDTLPLLTSMTNNSSPIPNISNCCISLHDMCSFRVVQSGQPSSCPCLTWHEISIPRLLNLQSEHCCIIISSSRLDATHSCICWYLEGVMTSSSASTGIHQPVGNMAARAAIHITADGLTPACAQATAEAVGSKPEGTWCESCSRKVAYMLEIPCCWTCIDRQAMFRSTWQLVEQFQVRVRPR